MITDITMNNVACYKSQVKLPIEKKVTLLYGLNGSGKSTLSNFLYDQADNKFSDCSVTTTEDTDILVYNQKFVEDFFYEDDSLKGVFTLSKENKDVKIKIKDKESELKTQNHVLSVHKDKLDILESDNEKRRKGAIDKVWEIKTKYAGGDRVLEYCLIGLMKKEKLYEHLEATPFEKDADSIDIDELKGEASSLQSDDATTIELLRRIEFNNNDIGKNIIFSKAISGSADGPVADFIGKLGNSDWVMKGLSYIQGPETESQHSRCPFCQEETISNALLTSIRELFDGQYKEDLDQIERFLVAYEMSVEALRFPSVDESKFATNEEVLLWKAELSEFNLILQDNLSKIKSKLLNPTSIVELSQTGDKVAELNRLVDSVNNKIKKYNNRIADKKGSLENIKFRFWKQMRRDYDQTLDAENRGQLEHQKKKNDINGKLSDATSKVASISREIVELRKKTVNVDSAVLAINSRLADLGAQGFTVKKHSDSMYRLTREGEDDGVFQTLSEGEKTLISFLYFIERCKGTLDPEAVSKTKTVVIDDPISSLSHIYIFNIGQYIKKEFVNSPDCAQVIVLTHSLYFFYELTFTKKQDRDEKQSLFRMSKTADGTEIVHLTYEEIQNDYQTYWSIVKNPSHQPALIANCMRNIIEYFFGFVRKKDFNSVFQMSQLADDKFQCFNRYMNRESHSLGQNIFDIKEFDYGMFIEGLQLVFECCGYQDHYKAMMK